MDQDATWYGSRPQCRRHCVRWGPSSPPEKRTQPHPIFGPCLLWPNGWMDEDATWYGSRPRPRPHCVRRGPAPLPLKGHSSPTVAHLSCCWAIVFLAVLCAEIVLLPVIAAAMFSFCITRLPVPSSTTHWTAEPRNVGITVEILFIAVQETWEIPFHLIFYIFPLVHCLPAAIIGKTGRHV